MILTFELSLNRLLRLKSHLSQYLPRTKKQYLFSSVLVLLLGNVLVSLYLLQSISKQSQLISEQYQNVTQLPTMQNRLQVANDQSAANAATLAQLQTTVKELSAQATTTKNTKVLGEQTTTPTTFAEPGSVTERPTPLGIVMVNTLNTSDKIVYDTPAMLTQLETVKPGTVMLYYKKDADWYQVDPPTHFEKMGWIQKDNLTEVPNVSELPH